MATGPASQILWVYLILVAYILVSAGIVLLGFLRALRCQREPARLRIVNLLMQGPLDIHRLQHTLQLPRTTFSRHLAYLRKRRMVGTKQQGGGVIYSLPSRPPRELKICIDCLRDRLTSDQVLRDDLARLRKRRTL